MTFTVWAQADVVTARLTLAPMDSAGALETTVLEAIAAGAELPSYLADVLGFAPSLVIDVLGDLWRADRITVHLGAEFETLALTGEGQEALKKAREGRAVESTARTSMTEEILVERLTGRVLPLHHARRRVPAEERDLVVPALPEDFGRASVAPGELTAALASSLANQSDGSADQYGDQRIVAASLQPQMLDIAAPRRHVAVKVSAHIATSDDITITVVDEHLSLGQRALAARRLQGILDRQPQSRFANRVRHLATRVPPEAQGVEPVMARLERLVHSMADCPADERQQVHDQAAQLAHQVAAFAYGLASYETCVQLVSTTAEHRAVIEQLIDSAERQVVIAVPWVRNRGLERIRSSLVAAVERGVQVVLLWGIEGHSKGLDRDEAGWLDAFTAQIARTGVEGRVLYSRRRAARSHAKVVIADDRRMLVTSKNFLSTSDHTEAGVLLSAVGNRPSPVIEAALQYVYDKAPDPRIAFGLHRTRAAFGERTELDQLPLPLPRLSSMLLHETTPTEMVRAWASAWADAVPRVRQLLDRPYPTVEPVADLQHRGVLRNALTDGQSRVLMTSDKAADQALSADVVALAKQRAAAGLRVYLRYREATAEAKREFDSMRTPGESAKISVTQSSTMHAKIALADDRVLIGSFNPLSVDADLRRRRSTGEFGVTIHSGEVADEVWQMFTGEPATDRSRPALVPVADEEMSPAALVLALAEAADSLSVEPLVALVRISGFATALQAQAEFGLSDVTAARTCAAGLVVALTDGLDAESAARQLSAQQLQAGNWSVAHLLRQLVHDPDWHPRLVVSQALRDGGAAGEALLSALTSGEDLSDGEAEALATADCVTLLLDRTAAADSDSATSLAAVPGAAPFVAAATAYLRRHGPLPPKAPMHDAAAVAETDLAVLWAASEEAYATFKRYDSRSAVGDTFHAVLFGDGGELSRLGGALSERDGVAVRAWYDEFVPNKRDDRWLDHAVHAAGIAKIVDGRRRTFLQLRGRVRRTTQDLCAALRDSDSIGAATWGAEQLVLLRDVLDTATERLASCPTGTAESDIVAEGLSRLLAWSEGRSVPLPDRDWHGSTFVRSRVAEAQGFGPDDVDLLIAVALDLGTVRTGTEAVLELAECGEFAGASELVQHLLDGNQIGDDQAKSLKRHIALARAETVENIKDRVESLERRSDRAGLVVPDADLPDLQIARRRGDVEQLLTSLEAEQADAIERRKAELAEVLVGRRDAMAGTWAAYVEMLVASGELTLAEHAIEANDGIEVLPRPRQFVRWAWRDERVPVVARWFDPESGPAPSGVRERFTPSPRDPAGQTLISALRALAAGAEEAAGGWVDAIQQLVYRVDEFNRPRAVRNGQHVTATFVLPYHSSLPRLKWVGRDPAVVDVGAVSSGQAMFRFSTETARSASVEPVVDVADILSLLALDDGTEPVREDRGLKFLTLLCGQLPLEAIIDPDEMPARTTEPAQGQLIWLLSILGVSVEAADVDRLRGWAGGHSGVLWALVEQARQHPLDGVERLGHRASRNETLVRGIELDLGRDEDILVLAVGLAGGFLQYGCTEGDLAKGFEDEWQQSRRSAHGIRVAAVLDRLVAKGYVKRKNGLLRSCGCAAALALERVAGSAWVEGRMDRVDPLLLMQERAFEFILDRLRHDQQASQEVLSDEVLTQQAQRRSKEYLSIDDPAPFDLVELCHDIRQDYREPGCDLLFELSQVPITLSSAGPRLWVELLVIELINNAYGAVKDLDFGEGTIWLTLRLDASDPAVAVLQVRNNGRKIPGEVREAFEAGRIWRGSARLGRGSGLTSFKRFGDLHGVKISLASVEGETVVECRFPVRGARPDQ